MTAAVQQGTHTAHPAWSRISDSLTHSPTQTAPVLPEWNRLYVASSLHLRPCHLLYEQHGAARLIFACDYRDSNNLGQLTDSNRLRAYVPALSHCVVTDLTDAQQLQIQLDSAELCRGAVRIPSTLSIRSGRGDHTTSHEFKTGGKADRKSFFESRT